MNLCSEGHDEICYEGKYCPACEIIKEFKGTIDQLEHDIELLNKED